MALSIVAIGWHRKVRPSKPIGKASSALGFDSLIGGCDLLL
jgi:hypothetical protein